MLNLYNRQIEAIKHLKRLANFGLKGNPICEIPDLIEQIIKLNGRIRILNNQKIDKKYLPERPERPEKPKKEESGKRKEASHRKDDDKLEKKQKRDKSENKQKKNKEEKNEVEEEEPVKKEKEVPETLKVIKEMIAEEVKQENKNPKKKERDGILKIENKKQNQGGRFQQKMDNKKIQRALKNESKIEGWD